MRVTTVRPPSAKAGGPVPALTQLQLATPNQPNRYLDRDDSLVRLVNQMISYGLLVHHDGYPVTHVAVYASRYQRLLRFPIEPLLNRLAGHPSDMDKTSAAFARLVQEARGERAA